jgi:Cupin-like domain
MVRLTVSLVVAALAAAYLAARGASSADSPADRNLLAEAAERARFYNADPLRTLPRVDPVPEFPHTSKEEAERARKREETRAAGATAGRKQVVRRGRYRREPAPEVPPESQYAADGALVTAILKLGYPRVVRNAAAIAPGFARWKALPARTVGDAAGDPAGATGWTPERFASVPGFELALSKSTEFTTQMHSGVMPLASGVEGVAWSREWQFANLSAADAISALLREPGKCAGDERESDGEAADCADDDSPRRRWVSTMLPIESLPQELQDDAVPSSVLSEAKLPGGKKVDLIERNVFIGEKGITTPLHYDIAHNFYVQVHGRKRFMLTAPDQWNALALYPRIHPSSRQSQMDLTVDMDEVVKRYPIKDMTKAVLEVVLEPGDVLYIPPYWGHRVTALEFSISIANHFASNEMELRSAIDSFFAPVNPAELSAADGEASPDEIDCAVRWVLGSFIRSLFAKPATLQKFLLNLVTHRFHPLEHDRHADGLWAKMVEARDGYRWIPEYDLSPPLLLAVKEASEKAAGLAVNLKDTVLSRYDREARFSLPLKHIELGNFLEAIAAHYVGPLQVWPFLMEVASSPPPQFDAK